jgi:ferritin-like protein
MTVSSPPPKLLPRNISARRKGRDPASVTRTTPGNPVSTRLESGIGNCFPGLECDLRNLERRFFPFLEVDVNFDRGSIEVAAVDVDGAMAAAAAELENYRVVQRDIGRAIWSVSSIDGDFGPLGRRTVTVSDLGTPRSLARRDPADAWTALRLLKEQSRVTLTLRRSPRGPDITLTGDRVRYLDDDGALSRLFEPGEMTQSLCSPWTHDFRDCGCYYWASNHPDIALPPLPDASTQATSPQWNLDTAWERTDRSIMSPPVVTIENGSPTVPRGSSAVREMRYHEISRDWQLLNFVLERREQIMPYAPVRPEMSRPFPDRATLVAQLRYAAGVELAVMLGYLSAAWSLREDDDPALTGELRADVRVAFAEMRRIAIAEMLHLRAVNDLLASLEGPAFKPAIAVASQIPVAGGKFLPVRFRAATPDTIVDFIEFEAPSQGIDGLYARILASLREGGMGTEEQVQSVRTLISEGGDHFQTFLFIQEWLGRHQPARYLVAGGPVDPPAGDAAHDDLQKAYKELLEALYAGLQAGMPRGAPRINAARNSMLGANGIEGKLQAVAAKGLIIKFDAIADPRFAPVAPPP